MIKKSIELLLKNPAIIIVYAVFSLAAVLLTLLFFSSNAAPYDSEAIILMLGRIILFLFLISAMMLIYLPGFFNMLAETVTTGTTTFRDFWQGVRRFFVRVLLAGLLFIAMLIGYSIILGMITIPITIISVIIMGGANSASTLMLSLVIGVVTNLITALFMPLIMLWLPAMFIDDSGVIDSLRKGTKAGIKNYLPLVITSLVLSIPSILAGIIGKTTQPFEINYSTAYWVSNGISFILGIIVSMYIFKLYFEWKTSISQS